MGLEGVAIEMLVPCSEEVVVEPVPDKTSLCHCIGPLSTHQKCFVLSEILELLYLS